MTKPNLTFTKDDFIDDDKGMSSVRLNNNEHAITTVNIFYYVHDSDETMALCTTCIQKNTREITVEVPSYLKFDGFVKMYRIPNY